MILTTSRSIKLSLLNNKILLCVRNLTKTLRYSLGKSIHVSTEQSEWRNLLRTPKTKHKSYIRYNVWSLSYFSTKQKSPHGAFFLFLINFTPQALGAFLSLRFRISLSRLGRCFGSLQKLRRSLCLRLCSLVQILGIL